MGAAPSFPHLSGPPPSSAAKARVFQGMPPSLEAIAKALERGEYKKVIVLLGPDASPLGSITSSLLAAKSHSLSGLCSSTPASVLHALAQTFPSDTLPSLAHFFVKELEERGCLLRVMTENVDAMESVAGIPLDRIVSLHGSVATGTCSLCFRRVGMGWLREVLVVDNNASPCCDICGGFVRPDICFPGDRPSDALRHTVSADMRDCDLIIVVGSQLQVAPATWLPEKVGTLTPRLLIHPEAIGLIDITAVDEMEDLAAAESEHEDNGRKEVEETEGKDASDASDAFGDESFGMYADALEGLSNPGAEAALRAMGLGGKRGFVFTGVQCYRDVHLADTANEGIHQLALAAGYWPAMERQRDACIAAISARKQSDAAANSSASREAGAADATVASPRLHGNHGSVQAETAPDSSTKGASAADAAHTVLTTLPALTAEQHAVYEAQVATSGLSILSQAMDDFGDLDELLAADAAKTAAEAEARRLAGTGYATQARAHMGYSATASAGAGSGCTEAKSESATGASYDSEEERAVMQYLKSID